MEETKLVGKVILLNHSVRSTRMEMVLARKVIPGFSPQSYSIIPYCIFSR